jgi:phospholipid/cholesterol/gamma-HCH transport system substrate-binding protein
MDDMRVLSDKLARHPELLGVRGAFQGSTGLKTSEDAPAKVPVRQASPNKAGASRQ